MSLIKRIVVQTYSYTLENFGPSLGTYTAGVGMQFSKFVVTVEADDGLRGSYAPHYGASPQTLAQVNAMAPLLLGEQAEQRELIFER
ncbi:MAG: hypothetical protein ACI8PT_003293, partial [Gammaproteobacteria bacterium]